MNYNDSVKTLQAIRTEYLYKGELIFKCAIQNVVECGTQNLTKEYLEQWLKKIDARHDQVEANGKIPLTTRKFDKDVAECTVKIAEIPPIDFLMYVQREVWLYNPCKYEPGEISYTRAIDLLFNVVDYALQDMETDIAKEDLEYMGFEDDELCFLGYEEIFFPEDDNDE